jgi:hypothetical protein
LSLAAEAKEPFVMVLGSVVAEAADGRQVVYPEDED